jgi:hypothetical protein
MALKPSDLSQAMLTAFPAAWKEVKGEDFQGFPGGDSKDAEVLFRAIAKGLLTYLEAHQRDMVTGLTMTIPGVTAGPYTVTNVDVNTDLT